MQILVDVRWLPSGPRNAYSPPRMLPPKSHTQQLHNHAQSVSFYRKFGIIAPFRPQRSRKTVCRMLLLYRSCTPFIHGINTMCWCVCVSFSVTDKSRGPSHLVLAFRLGLNGCGSASTFSNCFCCAARWLTKRKNRNGVVCGVVRWCGCNKRHTTHKCRHRTGETVRHNSMELFEEKKTYPRKWNFRMSAKVIDQTFQTDR